MHHQRREITLPVLAISLLAFVQPHLAQAQTVTPPAFSVLHTFSGTATDGAQPRGKLLQAADGNFYGTTQQGGANGLGTLYKITSTGVVTILHSFAGAADGAVPMSALVQAPNGIFYGAANQGGAHNLGTLFSFTPTTNTFASLHDFAGTPGDGALPFGSLFQTSDMSIYGTASIGGTFNLGTIYTLSPTAQYSTTHAFVGAPSEGGIPLSGLTLGRDGNLYGTTSKGGANNLGALFKITPTGTLTTVHSFVGTEGAVPEGGVIQGYDGNFYGMANSGTVSSGLGLGSVYKVTPAGVATVVHKFVGTTTVGTGTTAVVTADGSGPVGDLVQGTDGFLYGTTAYGGVNDKGCVFKLDPNGTFTILYSFAGTADGSNPQSGLVISTGGNLYGVSGNGGTANGGAVFKIATAITAIVPTFTGLSFNLPTVVGGQVATGTVTLSGAAPAGGLSIDLTSSNPALGTVTTALVPAGASSGTFSVTTVPVSGSVSLTITGTYGGATFSAPLTVTQQPGTNFNKGVSFFSIPYDYSSYSIPALFGYSSAQVAVYQPTVLNYALTPQAPADRIRPGYGYWARFPFPVSIALTGTPVDPTSTVTVPLAAGWNQIGDPFPVPIAAAALNFSNGTLTYGDASGVRFNLINPNLYYYAPGSGSTPGSYIAIQGNSQLQPGLGYWIHSIAPTDVEFKHP